jgi:hypothetical protein
MANERASGIRGALPPAPPPAFDNAPPGPMVPPSHTFEPNPFSPSHPEFLAILDQMAALHRKKGADYGTDADIFANVRSSERYGVPGWQGAVMRAGDKMARLQTYCRRGRLANEGVEDTLIDLANYAVIALVLFREMQESATDGPQVE